MDGKSLQKEARGVWGEPQHLKVMDSIITICPNSLSAPGAEGQSRSISDKCVYDAQLKKQKQRRCWEERGRKKVSGS